MDTAGTPRVSVIVRTKDRPRLLAEALGSLRAQTFRDFEAIVVNDGGAPPAGLEPAGASLRVIDTEAPHGRTRALNTGLRAARGRFVAYLDDDDRWLPEHLETLERFLSGAEGYQAAYTDVSVVRQALNDDGTYGQEVPLTVHAAPFSRMRLLSSNTIPLIALMHDRALALAVGGFDEAFDLYEDWDFLIRLSEKTRFHHLARTTAVYRLRDDGSNATIEAPWRGARSEAARLQLFRKHWAEHAPETQAGLVDALTNETERWKAEAAALRDALAEAQRENARLGDAVAAHAKAVERAAADSAAVREEAALVRADAARQLQAAGEREHALAREARRVPELEATLAAVHRSLAWRLFTPYWKLKSLLSR